MSAPSGSTCFFCTSPAEYVIILRTLIQVDNRMVEIEDALELNACPDHKDMKLDVEIQKEVE